MKQIIGFLFFLTVSAMTVFLALNSGMYNMSATEKHWTVTEKIIAWARDSSIESRAKDQQVPALDNEQIRLQGAEHYNAMCTICHLAPGMQSTELSVGLYPQAPKFFERLPSKDQAEKLKLAKSYFWVIKNGLKMTAMPAWGLTHDDDSMWAMVAFILDLGTMTPEQYRQIVQTAKAQIQDHSHKDDENHSYKHQGHVHE